MSFDFTSKQIELELHHAFQGKDLFTTDRYSITFNMPGSKLIFKMRKIFFLAENIFKEIYRV